MSLEFLGNIELLGNDEAIVSSDLLSNSVGSDLLHLLHLRNNDKLVSRHTE